MEYKRVFVPGGTYFFTVITYLRQPIFSVDSAIDIFKNVLIKIKKDYPFTIDAVVILPDHIHTILTLPENDANYPTRWRLIKANFSRQWTKNINNPLEKSPSRIMKSESTIWQRRYWEHTITSADDYYQHLEYVFYNPVKHGYVNDPKEWKYSFVSNNAW